MRRLILAVAALAMLACAAFADDVSDAIAGAGTAYGSGDYKETSVQLQTALAAVNQLLIEELIAAMPDPPSGWTADDPEGIDVSSIAAGFFATLVVERSYHPPDGSSIEMAISANSPLLVSLRMFASNPMMASMSDETGMKNVTTCGYDAIEHFGDGNCELHVLAGNSTLISFDSSEESNADHVQTLAAATDCETIVGIVE